MGLQIRDNRQRKALTGLSQAQFDHLLPFFSDIYEATQQKTQRSAKKLMQNSADGGYDRRQRHPRVGGDDHVIPLA